MTARHYPNFNDDHARLLALREFERECDIAPLVTRRWVTTEASQWVSGAVRVRLTDAGRALVTGRGRG